MTSGRAAGSAWHRLAAAAGRLLRSMRPWRDDDALDDAALRDLGLGRSELGSFQAEAEGFAPCTRRRCAALVTPGPPVAYAEVLRQAEGGSPNSRLNARLKAASVS